MEIAGNLADSSVPFEKKWWIPALIQRHVTERPLHPPPTYLSRHAARDESAEDFLGDVGASKKPLHRAKMIKGTEPSARLNGLHRTSILSCSSQSGLPFVLSTSCKIVNATGSAENAPLPYK
jgi:hypothetical protein